ncbi:hypothetical protein HDK64DRAFT_258748 [Phyllosticta capitalensis]
MTGGHPLHVMNIDKTPPRPSSVGGTQPETCERTSSPMEGHQGEEHVGTGDNTHNHGGIKRPASEPLTGQEFERPSSADDKSIPGSALPKHPIGSDAPGIPALTEHLDTVTEEEDDQDDRIKRPASGPLTGQEFKRPSSAGDIPMPGDALPKHPTGSDAPDTPAFAEHLTTMAKEDEDKPDEQRDATKALKANKSLEKWVRHMSKERLALRLRNPIPKRPSSTSDMSLPEDAPLKRHTGSKAPTAASSAGHITIVAEDEKGEPCTGPTTKRPSSAGGKSPSEDALSKNRTGSNAPATLKFTTLAECLDAMAEMSEDELYNMTVICTTTRDEVRMIMKEMGMAREMFQLALKASKHSRGHHLTTGALDAASLETPMAHDTFSTIEHRSTRLGGPSNKTNTD